MATVYFITETYVKEQSIINENVETNIINRSIIDAQTIHLQNILGSNLYQKLQDLVSSGDIEDSENAAYKSLLDDYIVQTLVQWTMVEALPYIRYKVMNKSVSGQGSDNSNPVDSADLKFFQQSLRDKAEFYSQRLSDHIVCNVTDYPEYTTGTSEDMAPDTENYFSGMELDDDGLERFWRKQMGFNDGITNLNW